MANAGILGNTNAIPNDITFQYDQTTNDRISNDS